jgi:hypothetical protein
MLSKVKINTGSLFCDFVNIFAEKVAIWLRKIANHAVEKLGTATSVFKLVAKKLSKSDKLSWRDQSSFQGCQIVYFQTFKKIGLILEGLRLENADIILWLFGIFQHHFGTFYVHLVHFFCFWYHGPKKSGNPGSYNDGHNDQTPRK